MRSLPDIFLTVPFAHRTLHDKNNGRPENSIEGAKYALSHGYAIEIDLQLSSDKVPMVFHDYVLDNLTNETGLLRNKTGEELSQIQLLNGKSNIPRFDEFLNLIDSKVPLLIEIKPQNLAFGSEESVMAIAIKNIVKNYSGALAFMSFNPYVIEQFSKYLPCYPRGLVTGPFLKSNWPNLSKERRLELALISDYSRFGACFVSHNANYLSSKSVKNIVEKGAKILCWTIKSSGAEDRARVFAQNITFEGYLPNLCD